MTTALLTRAVTRPLPPDDPPDGGDPDEPVAPDPGEPYPVPDPGEPYPVPGNPPDVPEAD